MPRYPSSLTLLPQGEKGSPLPSLTGHWTLSRAITAADGTATFSGTAEFVPLQSGALHYTERGVLTLPHGQNLSAFRTYIFQLHETGFTVFFDEIPPRLFHDVKLVPEGAVLLGSVSHFCAPDTYVSSYRFLPDGSFQIVHDVTGPKKSYASTTRYLRAP